MGDGQAQHGLDSAKNLGLKFCRGLLDSPKHMDSQRKALSLRQVPVIVLYGLYQAVISRINYPKYLNQSYEILL